MENIENKLNSSDPVVVSQAFSRLIQSIGAKGPGTQQEFSYLKQKCLSENSLISDTARLSLGKLIEAGAFQVDQALADFVTSVSTASNASALAKTIISLVYLQLFFLQRGDNAQPKSIKMYRLSEHPLVKILQGDGGCDLQMCIYKEIAQGSYRDLSLASSVNAFYEPLYLYSICSPIVKLEQTLLKEKLWIFLLKYDEDNGTGYVCKLCCWLQLQDKNNCDLSATLLDELFQRQLAREEPLKGLDYLILLQILGIHNMVLNNTDCRLVIKTLLLILRKPAVCHFNNLAILILSKAVMVCSPQYLEDLLQLCFFLCNHNACQPYSYLGLKLVLLHWLASPCLLTDKALKTGLDILQLYDHICRARPLIFVSRLSIDRLHYLTFCNPDIFLAMHLGIKLDHIRDNDVPAVLDRFLTAPLHCWKNCFNFLSGLLLHKNINVDDKVRVLNKLVECAGRYLEFLPTLLTLLFHELSNINQDNNNKLHFALLKALPPMAKVKENVPKVVATIQAIAKRSGALANFALRLMYDTWEIENKCYSALESMALHAPLSKDDWFETNVSKAYIFKQLSIKRPELYGKDLVAHLSKILNECTGAQGATACALALDGIRHLCKAEVIDIVTTWATLSPKFVDDNRGPVIKSLCGLIGEIPHLEYAQSYEKLQDDVTQVLWGYVARSEDEEVVDAAIEALAGFSLDLICLHMPETYLVDGNGKLQGQVEVQRVVPGKVWLNFLSTHKFKNAASKFLQQLINAEIGNYLKYVYQLKARREPDNYGALPTHSIVRAFGDYLKHNFEKVKNWELVGSSNVNYLFVECLKILSLKHPKPLPPLDWCFLQELIHVPAMKTYCLDLASRQAILSGSARRLMENYIVALTENSSTLDLAIDVYRNLKYLANSIQPIVLRPFFESSLLPALQGDLKGGVFEEALSYLREVLDDKEVQDVNKSVIEEVLTEMIFITDDSSEAFPHLLSGISTFSQKALEKITKFNSETYSEEDFRKVTSIRCHICKNTRSDTPLVWLNEIFAVACKNKLQLHLYCEEVAAVLLHNVDHEESPAWLNELFGEIQAKVADRCEAAEIGHFCDVLALAVLYFSGLFVILPQYGYDSIKYFFPAAVTFLLDQPMWSIYTTPILEWLHHMNTAESVPEEFQHIFGWALASLRHQEEFSKSSRWMKYLDCQIYTDNRF